MQSPIEKIPPADILYAIGSMARACLAGWYKVSAGMQKKKKKGGKPTTPRPSTVKYIYLEYAEKEELPYKVVREFDLMDAGDPTIPPFVKNVVESCIQSITKESMALNIR